MTRRRIRDERKYDGLLHCTNKGHKSNKLQRLIAYNIHTLHLEWPMVSRENQRSISIWISMNETAIRVIGFRLRS